MERLDKFIEGIQYKESEKEDIIKYLETKGVDRYCVIKEYLQQKNICLTWSNLSNTYRYDKRITYLLQRYLTFFEERIRAIICNKYLITEISKDNAEQKLSELFKRSELPEKIFKNIKHILGDQTLSLFEIIERSTLFLPLNFAHYIDSPELFGWPKTSEGILAVLDVRNAVAHNNFLLSYVFWQHKIAGESKTD